MNKSVVVYDGERMVGDVEVNIISPKLRFKDNKVRICYYSTPSERCSPLSVVYTVTSLCLKMKESNNIVKANSQLNLLHQTLLGENKTAVVSLGGDEMHLVAMRSRRNDTSPCFWGFIVPPGLYESCLVMLNLRCLGIVFDLDETLVVANTLRSFEDRLEAIQRRLNTEKDPARIAGLLSEIKRYQDDRTILKQYAESDQVVENGKIIKAESEVVPALSDKHQRLLRPVIRLQEKNIILTRINPLIRDTSVLVRMRPAWEDLRSYLFAKGRKRFEVYVCTMAEREYALEMWRLLDPDSSLITVKELSSRIVCVNSGSKKSLFNVFQDGNCHPKMALVIDDRLKVWDERDQPRVHAVPAFAPYYAPLAEANCAVPVLRVARNVACNVRGGFFRDFDEGLLQRINDVAYEDEVKDILPPCVSNYLASEGDACGSDGSKEPATFDGMADAEVERRLTEAISSSTVAPVMTHLDQVPKAPFLHNPAPTPATAPAPAPMPIVPTPGITMNYPKNQLLSVLEALTQTTRQEPSLHSSPAQEEGEVPESELDSDTRRRLLILQHGMDIRNPVTTEPPPQFPTRPPPTQVPAPRVEPCGGWFPLGEDTGPQRFNRISPSHNEFSVPAEPVHVDKKQTFRLPPLVRKEVHQRDDRFRLSHSPPVHPSFPGDEALSDYMDMVNEMGGNDTFVESPAEYLHYVASKCGTKVEFRPSLVPSIKLQFSYEVWFAGEKIGDATGRTRREAHHHAAESSLKNLADKYLSCLKSGEVGKFVSERIPNKGSIAALSELCMMEGLGFTFQPQRQVPTSMGVNNELYAQVEIDGEVWGKGVGLTWDEAKMQAAETAFQNLKAKIDQYPKKRQLSFRSFQGMPTKRFRPEYPRAMQRMAASSSRYP